MIPQVVTEDDIGLKVLRDAPADAVQIIDIVAVHGIGAHPDDTWCKNVGTSESPQWVNWLDADSMLPAVAPHARIMRYGYESQWFGAQAVRQMASTVAQRLLHALQRGRVNCLFRPLVFIAHCFGGLVVVKALLEARHHTQKWRGIFASTKGLVFLGTPFRGAEGMTQVEMLLAAQREYTQDEIQPEVLKILEPGNEFLQDMMNQFGEIRRQANKAQVACFYELKPSNVGRIVGNSDRMRFVVSESSGCLDVSGATSKYSLSRTHFDMNKFGKPTEEDFEMVREVIGRMIEPYAKDEIVKEFAANSKITERSPDASWSRKRPLRLTYQEAVKGHESIQSGETEWDKIMDYRGNNDRCFNCGSEFHWEYECRQDCGKCLSPGHNATQCEFRVRCIVCRSYLDRYSQFIPVTIPIGNRQGHLSTACSKHRRF